MAIFESVHRRQQAARDAQIKQAARRDLEKSVRAYNRAIERAVKSGKITAKQAPQKVQKVSDIFAPPRGASAKAYRAQARELAARLDKAQLQTAFNLRTLPSGEKVTQFEWRQYQKQYREAEKKRQQKAAEAAQQAQQAEQINGKKIEAPAWGKKLNPPKQLPPDKINTAEQLKGATASAAASLDHLQWESYKSNLLKNLKQNYTGADLAAIRKKIRSLTADQIKKAYETGQYWAAQEWHYDPAADHRAADIISSIDEFVR